MDPSMAPRKEWVPSIMVENKMNLPKIQPTASGLKKKKEKKNDLH